MDFTNLKNFIDTLPEYGIPSSDIIVYQNHKELWRHTVGEPLRGDELYYMYSCTKVVTCIAALQLFEQGKFLMKDPISNYLPEFDEIYVKKGSFSVACETPITFCHLFTMTAGFNYDLTAPHIREVVERTDGRAPTRELIAALAKAPLDFEPGTQFQYSLCHDVLAALVEELSGMTFGEYVKKNIFDQLGMKDSTFLLDDSRLGEVINQYRFVEGKGPVETDKTIVYKLGSKYESGGAGCISTVDDYIKLQEALRIGDIILKKSTVDMMATNQLTEEQNRSYGNPGYGYGLGQRCPMASDKFDFGWGGAAGAYYAIDRTNGISVCLATHILGLGLYGGKRSEILPIIQEILKDK